MRIFQGVTDTDITEIGQKQLKFLEKRFEAVHLDKIYSSPLIRTKKTAEAIKGKRDLDIEILPEIIELNGGFVEAKPFKETFDAYPEMKDAWFNHPEDFAPDGGEPMRDAYDRISNAFFKIVKENKGKTVACASHGGIIRCLLCRLIHNDITKLKDTTWLDNTAVCYFEVDDDLNVSVKLINDYSHLPENLLSQKSRLSSFMQKEVAE